MKIPVIELILSFYIQSIHSQPLVLIDEIKGNYSAAVDVEVNRQGNRYYLFDRASDSIQINGYTQYILPRDPLITSPYYFGRSYFTAIEGNQPIFIKRPGGELCSLTDSSVIVISNIHEDTLIATDTIFINAAAGGGSNLLLLEYTFAGVKIKSKHWQSTNNCWVNCNSIQNANNAFLFSGEYGGNAGGLLLDNHFLDIGSGNGNGFVGKMTNEKTVEWLRDISGYGYQVNNMIAINKKNDVLNTGASASRFVTFCADSLENRAVFDWGTDFLYFVQFDSSGQCINKKTIDYEYGNTIPTAIASLAHNSFVISGIFNPSYIGFDSFYLFNPKNDHVGFLVKLSDNLTTQSVFQLNGSSGSKYIESMVSDFNNNIWITGYTSADTLQVGNTVLVANPPDKPMGFFARLDINLNVLSAQMLEQGLGQKLIIGQDSNLYLLIRYAVNHHKLFKVMNPNNTNAYTPSSYNYESIVCVYPNPAQHEVELLNYELIQPSKESIKWINIYNIKGNLLKSEKTNKDSGTIHIGDINDSMIFIEFITNEFKRIIKKVMIK